MTKINPDFFKSPDPSLQQALEYHTSRFFDFIVFITDNSKNGNTATIESYISGWKSKLVPIEATWNGFFKAGINALVALVRNSLGIVAAVGKSLLPTFHSNEFEVCTKLYFEYYWG